MNAITILIQEFKKMNVLLLKSQGITHSMIANIEGISGNTIRAYLREYQEGGIERLKEIRFYQPQSELTQYSTTLEEYFRENPPATVKETREVINDLTGIQRGLTQVRKYLKSIGMRHLKVGSIPSKADPEEQARFKKEKLTPRLQQAKAGKRKVFFVDASHFVFGLFLGFLWSFGRLFIKTPAGRQRFNVLGALDAISHELITITNTSYINAQSVCDLLVKIRTKYKKGPVTLILDNAKYQRCKLVEKKAKSLKIELLFLPAYSPNLNLIERFWKLVKKECLYCKYYKTFSTFKMSITDFMDQANVLHKDKLNSLLTLNFQDFSKAQVMTE